MTNLSISSRNRWYTVHYTRTSTCAAGIAIWIEWSLCCSWSWCLCWNI